MSPTLKNVIVIGANGNIGASIFKAIVDSGKFNVSVLSRPGSTSTYAAVINVVKSDYTEMSLIESFKGQDAVVSALGAGGLGDEIKIISAAVTAGIKRFIPSEYSVNSQNTKTTDLVPTFGLKVRINAHLRAQESKGLSWTAIEAGAAFDYGLNFGMNGFKIHTKEALILDGGSRAFSATKLSQVGNAVVAVLSKAEETANKYIYIHSFTATQNEILAELENETAVKWTVTESTTEKTKTEGQELLAKGDFAGVLPLLKTIFHGEGYGSDFTKDAVLNNVMLGLPDQNLAWTISSIIDGKSV